MTNEEIKSARKAIWDTVYHDGPGKVEKARNALDALCAAASQPENTQGFDDWLDASPEWVDQIDRLEDTGHKQLVRRAMQAAWGAACKPESLVGRRVRLHAPVAYGSDDGIGTVEDGPHEAWTIEVDNSGNYVVLRDDFELLEGDDAE